MSLTVTQVSPGTDPNLPLGGICISDQHGNVGYISNGFKGETGPQGPQGIKSNTTLIESVIIEIVDRLEVIEKQLGIEQ